MTWNLYDVDYRDTYGMEHVKSFIHLDDAKKFARQCESACFSKVQITYNGLPVQR